MSPARFDPRLFGVLPDVLEQLRAAERRADSEIDLSDPDAPEWPARAVPVRGKFYRSVKKQMSLNVDKDVLAFFRGQGRGYQARINHILRVEMLRQLREMRDKQRNEPVSE